LNNFFLVGNVIHDLWAAGGWVVGKTDRSRSATRRRKEEKGDREVVQTIPQSREPQQAWPPHGWPWGVFFSKKAIVCGQWERKIKRMTEKEEEKSKKKKREKKKCCNGQFEKNPNPKHQPTDDVTDSNLIPSVLPMVAAETRLSSNPNCSRYTHPPIITIPPLCSPHDTLHGGGVLIVIG